MANFYSLNLELSSSHYANVADSTSLSITGDLSMEAWVKLEQLPSTAGTEFVICGKWTADTAKRSYNMRIDTSNKLVLYWSGNGSTESTLTADAATFEASDVSKWVHVAATLDVSATDGVLYKNATEVASTPAGVQTSVHDNATPFSIGAQNVDLVAEKFFDGLIDEVRVWNDIRSGAEISSNYLTELVGNEAGLAAYWRLENNYLDETANNNDLTGVNVPTFSSDNPFLRSPILFFT